MSGNCFNFSSKGYKIKLCRIPTRYWPLFRAARWTSTSPTMWARRCWTGLRLLALGRWWSFYVKKVSFRFIELIVYKVSRPQNSFRANTKSRMKTRIFSLNYLWFSVWNIFDLFYSSGADVNRGQRSSSLHYAACFGRPAIAKVLLRYGANADLRDEDGKTPLDKARERHDQGIKSVCKIII